MIMIGYKLNGLSYFINRFINYFYCALSEMKTVSAPKQKLRHTVIWRLIIGSHTITELKKKQNILPSKYIGEES